MVREAVEALEQESSMKLNTTPINDLKKILLEGKYEEVFGVA